MGAAFSHRGVVEGYYGPPYSPADRLWLIDQMGEWGMNRYLYAPKDDPLHREQWRVPYPAESMRDFAELVERGAARGVSVGFGLSPGLSIHYASEDDAAALCEKLGHFVGIGARFFALALDDVPCELVHDEDRRRFESLAAAQVALAHRLRESLPDDSLLWLVPTEYLNCEPSDYLETLGATLDPAIEIGWTGRTVVSPTIRADEAAARAATLRRRLLVWDNVPVNDGPMRTMLHLGPYRGRDASLPESVSGMLLNPMQQPRASAVCLATAAAFLRDPAHYEPEASWDAALERVGRGAEQAFAVFAAAHRFSALLPDDRDPELEAAFGALRESMTHGRGADRCLAALRALLAPRLRAAEELEENLEDRRLALEIADWLQAHRRETERIEAAVDLLAALLSDATALQRALALFRMEGRLTRRPPAPVASYGPRRVIYPQLISNREEEAGFGSDPPLYRNRCLADEIVDFAEAQALALRD